MKKQFIFLLFAAFLLKTTAGFAQSKSPLFILDLKKSKARVKDDAGNWKDWEKVKIGDWAMGVYTEYNGNAHDEIKIIDFNKKSVIKLYKCSPSGNETKDNTQYMSFAGKDMSDVNCTITVSYYPSSASMRTAEWLKVTVFYPTSEREYEAKYLVN